MFSTGHNALKLRQHPPSSQRTGALRPTSRPAAATKGDVGTAGQGVIRLIDEQRWLEPVGDTLQKAIKQAYASGGTTGQHVKILLSGTWLGHPLHPVLTDVPIGAWTVALACDALEAGSQRAVFAPGADAAVAIGLGGALGAALSGLSDWHFTVDRPRRLGLAYGLLNLSATGLYSASLVARRRGARGWGRSLALVG